MAERIHIILHEAVPKCGSFEVRFPDGRPSRYFYWDDIAGHRLRPDLIGSETAKKAAESLGGLSKQAGPLICNVVEKQHRDCSVAFRSSHHSHLATFRPISLREPRRGKRDSRASYLG